MSHEMKNNLRVGTRPSRYIEARFTSQKESQFGHSTRIIILTYEL